MNQHKNIRLSVDRTEADIVICFDDFGNKYELSADIVGHFKDGDIIYATFSEGNIISAYLAEEETSSKKAALQNRLNRLFDKKNN
ncbi:MAG: DUF3006 domain-containing protein [Clostridiales bacterium]|nr:DUF3006 domain-containing protein [Clostridiales bacterium]